MKSEVIILGLRGLYFSEYEDVGYADALVGPTPNMLAAIYTLAFCCLAEDTIDSEHLYQVQSFSFKCTLNLISHCCSKFFSAILRFLTNLEQSADPNWLSIFDFYVRLMNEGFAN
jgi:hypothetical protein